MISLTRWKKLLVVLLLGTATAIMSPAQTFKTLLDFNGTNGATPVYTSLLQGRDGNLYGTTAGGGSNGSGTVFKITAAGKLTTLYSFCSQANCGDGLAPQGGLVLGRDGNFYGTTSQRGANGDFGTVFKITPRGTLTTLHSFNLADGAYPLAGLVQGRDGDFYGATSSGPTSNHGTLFRITSAGSLTTLHVFDGTDGSQPLNTLIQGADGNLYGTTPYGAGYGTIFKITPSGRLTILHRFNVTDGAFPYCALLQAADRNFYGTTSGGGDTSKCYNRGCGTIFKITPNGTLTTLHNFDSTEGATPFAGLIQATDGNFYGTTYGGGNDGGWGVVFKITTSRVLTTLHSFDGNDGGQPFGPLAQATNGNLYGTATSGLGIASRGTIFDIATGFRPFVSFVSNSGKVGQVAGILGQGFTGTTGVSFNGAPAQFIVKSATFITATVPAGATTGFVKLITPSGRLTSNVRFQVVP